MKKKIVFIRTQVSSVHDFNSCLLLVVLRRIKFINHRLLVPSFITISMELINKTIAILAIQHFIRIIFMRFNGSNVWLLFSFNFIIEPRARNSRHFGNVIKLLVSISESFHQKMSSIVC